jgi:hypothetical protein
MPALSSVIWLAPRSTVFQNLPVTWADWCQRWVLWSDWPQEAHCFKICQSPEPIDASAEFIDLVGPKKRSVSESASHLSRLMPAQSSVIWLAPKKRSVSESANHLSRLMPALSSVIWLAPRKRFLSEVMSSSWGGRQVSRFPASINKVTNFDWYESAKPASWRNLLMDLCTRIYTPLSLLMQAKWQVEFRHGKKKMPHSQLDSW